MGLFNRKKKKKQESKAQELFDFDPFKSKSDLKGWESHLKRLGIDPSCNSSSPIQLMIKNNTEEIKNAVLFGSNRHLLTKGFGSDEGLEITPVTGNISYLEILQSIAHDPIETSLIRIQSANTSQVTQVMTIYSSDVNGQSVSIPIIVQSYFSTHQFQAGIVDVPFVTNFDGNTDLSFPVLPQTTVTITFFYKKKSDILRMDIIEKLKEVGITPEFIDSFMKKKERKDRRKARVAKFKKQLAYIFSFKWIIPKKKIKIEDKLPKGIQFSTPIISEDTKTVNKDEDKKSKSKESTNKKEGSTEKEIKNVEIKKESPEPEKVEEPPAEDTELSPAEEHEREDGKDEFRSADGQNSEPEPKKEDGE